MAEFVSQRFDAICRKQPDRPAFYERTGGAVPYGTLFQAVQSFAESLAGRGVGPGRTIGIRLSDASVVTAVALAVMRVGGYVFQGADKIEATLQAGIDFVLTDPEHAIRDPRVFVLNADWVRPARGVFRQTAPGGLVTSTSGTTGIPKRQAMPEEVLLARIDAFNANRGVPDAPVFNGYNIETGVGMEHTLRALFAGQPQLQLDVGVPLALRFIEEKGVKIGLAPPFVLKSLVEEARRTGRSPKMNVFYAGGGAVSLTLAEDAEKIFGCPVYSGYGSSESGGIAQFRVLDGRDTPGAVGHIHPHFEHRLVDEMGNETADEGELWIRVPQPLQKSSYLGGGGPYDPDGWMGTGDVGHFRADGVFVITGRRAEFINGGGNKWAPKRFEELAEKAAGVRSSIAFAIANDWGFEDVGLIVVADRPVAEEALRAALAVPIQRGFVLRVFFRDDIPASAAGKADRRSLGEAHAGLVPDLLLR